MLTEARQRLPKPSLFDRLRSPFSGAYAPLVGADMETMPLAADCVDLIWSNLAMQWIATPENMFREMRRILKSNGLLLFSTFGPDTLRELRTAFSGLDGYSHVNRFTDMHDIGDALIHAGFSNPVMEMEHLTLTYTDLKGLMRDLKGIGAHTVLEDRRQGLMGRHEWQQLIANYETFRREDRLPATYEVIYGHAWVGDKSHWDDGRKVIQLKIEQRQAGLR
jgi:malonyl-CoA O-methyltransferase